MIEAGLAGLVFIQFLWIWKLNRQLSLIQNSAFERQQILEEKISMTSMGAIGVGKRLLKVERLLRERNDKSVGVVNQEIADELSDLDTANRLINAGKSLESVVEETGISFAEAQLLQMLRQSAA